MLRYLAVCALLVASCDASDELSSLILRTKHWRLTRKFEPQLQADKVDHGPSRKTIQTVSRKLNGDTILDFDTNEKGSGIVSFSSGEVGEWRVVQKAYIPGREARKMNDRLTGANRKKKTTEELEQEEMASKQLPSPTSYEESMEMGAVLEIQVNDDSSTLHKNDDGQKILYTIPLMRGGFDPDNTNAIRGASSGIIRWFSNVDDDNESSQNLSAKVGTASIHIVGKKGAVSFVDPRWVKGRKWFWGGRGFSRA